MYTYVLCTAMTRSGLLVVVRCKILLFKFAPSDNCVVSSILRRMSWMLRPNVLVRLPTRWDSCQDLAGGPRMLLKCTIHQQIYDHGAVLSTCGVSIAALPWKISDCLTTDDVLVASGDTSAHHRVLFCDWNLGIKEVVAVTLCTVISEKNLGVNYTSMTNLCTFCSINTCTTFVQRKWRQPLLLALASDANQANPKFSHNRIMLHNKKL